MQNEYRQPQDNPIDKLVTYPVQPSATSSQQNPIIDIITPSDAEKQYPPQERLLKEENKSRDVQSILPPFSKKLQVDGNLKLIENSNSKICTRSSKVKKFDLDNVPNYPTPYFLAQLSSKVYTDLQQGEVLSNYEKRLCLPNNWKLLAIAFNHDITNGYFGAAYWHSDYRQVVIAHRGTKLTSLGAILSDVQGIVFNNYVAHMSSAATFSEKITEILSTKSLESNIGFQLFFTGHSLGGWLAQITTFTTEYLHPVNGLFQRNSEPSQYHAHTVVFDSPGCAAMLSQMKENFDARYNNRSIELASLDITSYLSAPNRINTCNTHIGTIYRIFTNLSDINWHHKYTVTYNLVAHSLDKILQALDPNPKTEISLKELGGLKLQEVVDWPITGGIIIPGEEYKSFFEWADHLNDYHPDSANESFRIKTESGYYPIRYQTKPVDEKFCHLSVFTATERQFLEYYRWLLRLPNFLNPQELFASESDKSIKISLEDFEITENHIHCKTAESLQKIIPYVKRLLTLYPKIPNKAAKKLSEKGIVQEIYKTESNRYINKIQLSNLDFKNKEKNHELKKFLENKKQKICKFKMIKDTQSSLIWIYRNSIYPNSKFSEKNLFALTLEQMLDIHQYLADVGKLFSDSLQLLMIECPQHASSKAKALLKSLVKTIKDRSNVKLILISLWQDGKDKDWIQKTIEETQLKPPLTGKYYCQKEIYNWNWKDLDTSTQKDLLIKTLQIQGKSITLCQLLFNKESPDGLEDSLNLSAEMVMQLMQAKEANGLLLDHEPLRLSDLESAYSKCLEKIDNGYLQKVLIDSKSSNKLFIFSGLDSTTPETFIQKLDVKKHSSKNCLTEQIGQQIEGDKNIILVKGDYNEQQFKRFCRDNINKQIYWISVSSGEWLWQHKYNPDFYIQRSLKKVAVNSFIKDRLLSDSSERFIFSGLSSEDLLFQLLKIRENYEKEDIKQRSKMLLKQTDEAAEIEFNHLAKSEEPIHWLTVDDTRCLIWQCSHPSSTPSPGMDPPRGEFSLLESERLVVVSDEPGMGKSTMLARLTEQRLGDAWIVQLNLKDCQQHLIQLPNSPSLKQVFDFLWKEHQDNSLTREIFYYHLTTVKETPRPLLILLDSFNEIPQSEQRKKVEALLNNLKETIQGSKHQVIVTTRCHSQLEHYLGLPYTVQFERLNEPQRIQFLKNFWYSRSELLLSSETIKNFEEKSDIYINALSDKAHTLLSEKTDHLISIPLQIRLLAESLQDKFKNFLESTDNTTPNFDSIQVTVLYQNFIEYRLQIYFKRNQLIEYNIKNIIYERLMECHRRLAFKILLDPIRKEMLGIHKDELPNYAEELYQVGLVKKSHEINSFEFVHHTFAEYLIAESLLYPLTNFFKGLTEQLYLLNDILLKIDHKVIRMFLDNFLFLRNDLLPTQKLKEFSNLIKKTTNKHRNMFDETILHVSSRENNVNIINFLFESRADEQETIRDLLEKTNIYKLTALHLAAQHGHQDVVKALLDNGANVNVKEIKCEWTPLHFAALGDHKEVVKILLAHKGDVSAKTNSGWTPLHLAASGSHKAVFQTLLSSGADVNAETDNKFTPLHLITESGDKEMIELLLTNQEIVKFNTQTDNGLIPLHIASTNGYQDIVEILLNLNNDADINSRTFNGYTPLLLAAAGNHDNVFKFLVKQKNVEIDAETYNKWSALKFAVTYEYKNIISILQELGEVGDIKKTDDNKYTLLHLAAQNGHCEAVKALLAKEGTDINKKEDDNKRTALHLAAQNGHEMVVNTLLFNHADVNANDSSEWTPLHLAAQNGHEMVVNILLSNRANVNAKTDNGYTPLHLAAENGHQNIVIAVLFLCSFVEVEAKTHDGKTPLNLANTNNHQVVSMILENRPFLKYFAFHTNHNFLLMSGRNCVEDKTDNGLTLLHLAAANGHQEAVKTLLTFGSDVNAEENNKFTALHLAAANGHQEVVKTLLNNDGANVSAKATQNEWTPLHLAAANGHQEVIDFLLTRGAKVDDKMDEGRTPLHLAAANGHQEVVDFLLTRGAKVDDKMNEGRTPLHLAAANGHQEVVDFLLTRGAKVDDKMNEGRTPLHLAAANGHQEVVDFLLTRGAKVDDKMNEGRTPLHLAAASGHQRVVDFLLTKGAKVDDKMDEGRTPLHLAAENGHQEVSMTLLLSNNPIVNNTMSDGKTPLHLAAENNHPKIIEILLLVNNIDTNAKTNNGDTAKDLAKEDESIYLLDDHIDDIYAEDAFSELHLAANNGDQDSVEALLAKGAKVDDKMDEGRTPLHLAAENGHQKVVDSLLTGGAKVDDKMDDGRTPLHLAAENGRQEVVDFLLTKGAKVDDTMDDGRTPLHLAAENGRQEVVDFLLTKGAKVDDTMDDGRTPLHLAAENGRQEVVDFLLTKGAKVDDTMDDGRTPLHLAAENGRQEVVDFLLTKGAKVDDTMDDGRTPLHLAVENGHRKVINALRAQQNINFKKIREEIRNLQCNKQNKMLSPKEILTMTEMCNKLVSASVAWEQTGPMGGWIPYQRYIEKNVMSILPESSKRPT